MADEQPDSTTWTAHIGRLQKLDTLRDVVGGATHTFNNLLTAITVNTATARRKHAVSGELATILNDIESAANRATSISRQLQGHIRPDDGEIRTLALDGLVDDMANLLRAATPKLLALSYDLQPVTVQGNEGQLQQLVLNLVLNAADAHEGKAGTITVSTGSQAADGGSQMACLRVTDTGGGMSAEVQTRMTEAFYSTRGKLGLGATAAQAIVAAHGGTMTATAMAGGGTCMRVLLPRLADVAEPAVPVAADTGQQRTILVLDDEAVVRDFVVNLLEDEGYTVLSAGTLGAGLRALLRHESEVALILLDATLEGADGMSALNELRSVAPAVPVVLMSGYDAASVGDMLSIGEATAFLQKPIAYGDLLSTVARATTPPAETD